MTVAAVIFYNGGVLLVSDSRGVMLERTRSSSSSNSMVTYLDDRIKSASSDSGDVAAVALGDEGMAVLMLKELLEHEELLTEGGEGGLDAVRTRVYSMAAGAGLIGEGGVLAAVHGIDGTLRVVEVYAAVDEGSKAPKVSVGSITRDTARGFDGSVQRYLNSLVRKHCPDRAAMGLTEAIAVGFMLEERFMRHKLEIVPGKMAVMAGGPIRMHVVSNDAGHGYGIVVYEDQRRGLLGKEFGELRDYFADKMRSGDAVRPPHAWAPQKSKTV